MRTYLRILLVVITLLTVTLSISAQSPWWNGAKSEEGPSLSVEAGLNLSRFHHVDLWNRIKAGVNVGVMAEKPVLQSLSIKAGLFYTLKGAVGKNDAAFGGTLTTTFSPAYLEIPVLASYRYTFSETARLQFDFGPYFAVGLHGKDKKKYSGNGSYTSSSEIEYNLFGNDAQLKRFDFGFRFGPKIVWNDKVSVAAAYEISAFDISRMGGKIGNGNFMINVGYTFLAF